MKILFISRSTLYKDSGGDTIQLINTARELCLQGVEVDIRLSDETIDYSKYNLIHFFNVIRPADVLIHIKKSGKPYVVSTIYVSYNEYDKTIRKGLSGLMFRLLPSDFIEYLKVLARSLFSGEKVISPEYLYMGHRCAVQKVLKHASLLLPNSESEYRRVSTDYGVIQKYKVIPNAIDEKLFACQTHETRKNNVLISVGRVEGRKNQLGLIHSVLDSEYTLYIIGAAARNQPGYYNACKEYESDQIIFVEKINQEELLRYYSLAKVHVLASWFETTGLSSLEAAVMGCNCVITEKGDTREYFENMAWYCDPGSTASIRKAIDDAVKAPFVEKLRNKILENYTWKTAASKTLEAYKEALGFDQ